MTRDSYLPAPVVDALFIVDLLAETVDDLAGSPLDLLRTLLLLDHLVKDGHNPVFKLAVVGVGNQEISNAVQPGCQRALRAPGCSDSPLLTQLRTVQMKLAEDG